MITKSESIANIASALLDFQGAVKGVKRDSANPFFKSKYADLEQVVETAKPHLQAAGIAFLQSPGTIQNDCLSMSTMLMHSASGEWIIGTGEIPLGKKDPQGAGSAQTYAQRYHLMAMLGLPPTDDDGEAAMDRAKAQKTPEKPAGGNKTQDRMVGHVSAISAAIDLDKLKKAWEAIDADQALSQDDYDQLKGAVNQRKAQLTKPAVEPTFDNLQP